LPECNKFFLLLSLQMLLRLLLALTTGVAFREEVLTDIRSLR
jgi:hypothetical protein